MREETESGRAQRRNCEEIREEFRVRKLGFADAQSADFVKAQVKKLINILNYLAIFVWSKLIFLINELYYF